MQREMKWEEVDAEGNEREEREPEEVRHVSRIADSACLFCIGVKKRAR